MSFSTIETSVDSGRPLELMLVSYLTNHWSFTTSEEPVIHDGRTYIPLPMQRTEIAPTGDVSKSSITIKVPQDCPVGELFRVQPPSGVVTVTLFAKHVDDVEVKTIWKGRIVNVEWEQPWLSLTSENVFSSLRRLGLRRKYSVQCLLPLYSVGESLCNANKDSFKETHTVAAISGSTISCPTIVRAAGYFAGGYMTWIHATKGYLEQRMITESDASGNLVIPSPPPGLVAGAEINIYPGCDHSLSTCHAKFNNSENFGGTPFIPQKNPFGGSTMY